MEGKGTTLLSDIQFIRRKEVLREMVNVKRKSEEDN